MGDAHEQRKRLPLNTLNVAGLHIRDVDGRLPGKDSHNPTWRIADRRLVN
jgi:hypothetical protein